MAKSRATAPSTRARRGWPVLLSLVLVFICVTAAMAQDYVPQGSYDPDSWDPKFPKWVSGQNSDLMEGQTAPMAVQIVNEQGKTYELALCLQVTESPYTGAYGFTAFEPFDKSFLPFDGVPAIDPIPMAFETGAPIDYPTYALPAWDRHHPLVWGYNITINSVTDPSVNSPICEPQAQLGVLVDFTVNSNTDAYLVFGGHFAKAGDLVPPGAVLPPGQVEPYYVQPGQSASFMTGVFDARMATPAGDKTLPYKVIFNPNAVELSSFGATASQALPYGLSLLGLAAAGAAGFAFRRRKQG
jgi:hypothetical protein